MHVSVCPSPTCQEGQDGVRSACDLLRKYFGLPSTEILDIGNNLYQNICNFTITLLFS